MNEITDKTKIAILPHPETTSHDVPSLITKNFKRNFWVKTYSDWQKSQDNIKEPFKK